MSKKISIRRNPKHQALNDACATGDMAQVRALVEEGLDLSEPWSVDYYTPLSIAMARNDVPLIAYLLEHGMPPYLNLRSIVREDPEGDASDYSLLGLWCPEHHEALMYLLEHGSPANSGKTGYNALVGLAHLRETGHDVQIGAKSDDFFAALLSWSPDVDQVMDVGGTLLHHIVTGNNRYVPPLVALSKQVNAPEEPGYLSATPLRSAARYGADIAVEALLKAGANPSLMDRYHHDSILDTALSGQKNRKGWPYSRHERVIELLRAHGARTRLEMLKAGEISWGE
ncbi:Ankyrin repeats (3 copies) [compost metagenome]